MDKSTLQQHISRVLTEAVTLDQQGHYAPAIEKYQIAIGLLDQLIQCTLHRCTTHLPDENEYNAISALQQKRMEYVNRVEVLGGALGKNSLFP
jgi:hypothetical protein